MKKSIFASMAMLSAVLFVGCGQEDGASQSVLNQSRPGLSPQGEPDFKTKDGLEILTWAKKPGVSKAICEVLKEATAKGYSSVSPQAAAMVAQRFELHVAEAEVVSAYAQSFSCPELP